MDEAGAEVERMVRAIRKSPPAAAHAAPRVPITWAVALRVLARATVNFIDDNAGQMAAAISYYALFSLFPLTLLAVSIFGLVLRAPGVQDQILNAIIAFVPMQDQSIAKSLRGVADLGPTLTIVSTLGTLWSASALSAAVRSALNVVFEVERGRPPLRDKLVDYLLIPIIGLPLVGGLVLTAAWRFTEAQFTDLLGSNAVFRFGWHLGTLAIPLGLSFVAFMLAFKVLPNTYVRFRYLWPGALLAALGFEALKAGFSFYVQHFANFDVVYGSVGSVIVLLFWVYLTTNIMLYGAEVSAEVPHVLYEEPRKSDAPEGNWRTSLIAMLRGLVLAGDNQVDGAQPQGTRRPK